jgi:hypothetical protein
LWISPRIISVGSAPQYLIDAGVNSAASGAGLHTSKFTVDYNGNTLGAGNISYTNYSLLDADAVTYKTALDSPLTNVIQLGKDFTTAYLPSTITLPKQEKVGLAIRGSGSGGNYEQSADLTQWLSYDGTVEALLAKIDKDGKAHFPEVYTKALRLEAVSADTNIGINKNWHTWSFTGSAERVWTLPSATPENYYYNYFVKNRGSANLTIEGTIYTNSAVSSIVLVPGEGVILTCDGTYWIVISKN